MQSPWLDQYPPGVPAEADVNAYRSVAELLESAFRRHAQRDALCCMDQRLKFRDIDEMSQAMGAWLQAQGLKPGDRVAVMMPNVPQYLVAIAGILRAGFVVVNVNPLYTARELQHQLRDSGAVAAVVLENFAVTLEEVIDQTEVQHVVLAALGDLLGYWRGRLLNFAVRHVKRMVPEYSLPLDGGRTVTRFNAMLEAGAHMSLRRVDIAPGDVAFLQYTGGTTGVSKGAVLLHRNVVANLMQVDAWFRPKLAELGTDPVTVVCALPLYHIFALTICALMGARLGMMNLLIANPRDIPAMFKDLRRQPFHSLPAVNTLFNAMANHPEFDSVDWSSLVMSVGGGMAVQQATAQLWLQKTGCPICEGYGLSETSPAATCNPVDTQAYSGTIGMPMPDTDVVLLDDDGNEVGPGERGEIAIRGPQVMAGYWQRPDETAKVMTADGFFRTGDIGEVDERGFFKIVDRKKDMILVSGFNVYPNEVEDIVALIPGVLECAAVGVPDEKAGEAVKIVIVKKDPALTEADVRAWCETNLTGYKRPKIVEFRSDLPKTNVGKILRRELRDGKRS